MKVQREIYREREEVNFTKRSSRGGERKDAVDKSWIRAAGKRAARKYERTSSVDAIRGDAARRRETMPGT